MAAPLFFSGDMRLLDDFTLGILCSKEAIDVDQDPLGRQAKPLAQDDETLILAKPMEDGSVAVGLFNLAELPRRMSVDWSLLGLQGWQRVRDLWRQKDLGEFADRLAVDVPRHGVALIQVQSK
jgi:alpha-galactosidase